MQNLFSHLEATLEVGHMCAASSAVVTEGSRVLAGETEDSLPQMRHQTISASKHAPVLLPVNRELLPTQINGHCAHAPPSLVWWLWSRDCRALPAFFSEQLVCVRRSLRTLALRACFIPAAQNPSFSLGFLPRFQQPLGWAKREFCQLL